MYMATSDAAGVTITAFAPLPLTAASSFQTFATGVPSHKDGESQLQRWSSLIGIITAIVGNILISFALNIQRYAHIRLNREVQQRRERSKRPSQASSKNGYGATTTNGVGNGNRHTTQPGGANQSEGEETDPLIRSMHLRSSDSTFCTDDDHDEAKTYLQSPYWWAGILLMTIGETGNFLAYGFAPASIVSPLGVVALISNVVIAPIMLKERFRWRDFWGVVVAVGGAVTVVLSAKQKEKKLGPHEVIEAITTTGFEVYMGITIALIVALAWASPKYGNRTVLVDLGLVGLFGGYTALSTKGVASMLSSTLWKAFTTPITYALIAVLVGTAIMQVKYVNKALQRFDSTQVIPVQFVMFTLSVIIGSAVLYGDFEKTTKERAFKFVGGCLLTFFGVFLITSGRASSDDEYDDYDEDNEERIGLTKQNSNGVEAFDDENHKHANAQPIEHRTQASGYRVDGEDSPIAQSRRSSRISFAPTPTRPESHRYPSMPSIQLASSNGPSRTSFDDSPLLTNPWRASHDDTLPSSRPPPVTSTMSSSVLPPEVQSHEASSADSLAPRLPTIRTQSQQNPQTHPNEQNPDGPPQAADHLRPVTPSAAMASAVARHHSISRMMPGPFISPLSSSLSAVVADEMRRNAESPPRKRQFRRPKLSLQRRADGQLERHGSESETSDVEATRSAGAVGGSSLGRSGIGTSQSLGARTGEELMRRSRARSLSNALGDFLRGKRARKGDGVGRDDEGEQQGHEVSRSSEP